NYIKLDGTIGCMVNGAGLAMATMDTIKFLGGDAANFLDIGGGAKAEKIKRAFGIIASDPNVKSILINIFGGITRCDEVAKGVIAAKKSLEQTPPIVARLIGMNSDEAKKMLANEDIKSAETLKEAAEFAIGLSKGDR
ncbi:MAG TPA: succinate--CoA ligase subunit beta, partial [Bellilinea sp.]|nr:succinate--CoA ligase subunit beta [Bellilinea sp.]